VVSHPFARKKAKGWGTEHLCFAGFCAGVKTPTYQAAAYQDHAEEPKPEVSVDALFELVRHAAPFGGLSRAAFEGVLDLLSGRYPSGRGATSQGGQTIGTKNRSHEACSRQR